MKHVPAAGENTPCCRASRSGNRPARPLGKHAGTSHKKRRADDPAKSRARPYSYTAESPDGSVPGSPANGHAAAQADPSHIPAVQSGSRQTPRLPPPHRGFRHTRQQSAAFRSGGNSNRCRRQTPPTSWSAEPVRKSLRKTRHEPDIRRASAQLSDDFPAGQPHMLR